MAFVFGLGREVLWIKILFEEEQLELRTVEA